MTDSLELHYGVNLVNGRHLQTDSEFVTHEQAEQYVSDLSEDLCELEAIFECTVDDVKLLIPRSSILYVSINLHEVEQSDGN